MTKRRLVQVEEKWPLFESYFDESVKITESSEFAPRKGDVLLLWGGPDVNPEYYHDEATSYTHWNDDRDILDFTCLNRAVDYGIPVFGVCRGMQLMSPYCGGTLIQDTPGHQNMHSIQLDKGRIGWTGEADIVVNSVHHQLIRPYHGEIEVVGWNRPPMGRNYVVGPRVYPVTHISQEPEVVLFPHIKSVGVQFHPEYPDAPKESVKLAHHLFKKFIMENDW